MRDSEHVAFHLSSAARFAVLIGGSIFIAIAMVAASLSLYASTGTAQLDLSRPGYAEIRKQATTNESSESFDANGPINDTVISDFTKQYDKKLNQANSVDAFGEDVLSEKSLQIDTPASP